MKAAGLQRWTERAPPVARPHVRSFKIEITQHLKYAESRLACSKAFATTSAQLACDYAGLGASQVALQTTGEIIVEVDRDTAFKFIEVPEQLPQRIPDCPHLHQLSPP